jgi:CRISPR/Cas system CSM-associated protein Csm4 (group 5 of RAMP superfamily)
LSPLNQLKPPLMATKLKKPLKKPTAKKKRVQYLKDKDLHKMTAAPYDSGKAIVHSTPFKGVTVFAKSGRPR